MTRKIWDAPMPGRKMDTDPTVFNKVLFPNIIRNASRLSRTQRLSRIERRWSGKNTFVIGAGPSLDANLDFIKEKADKIIAVDMAVIPLLKAGVNIDAIVSVEYQEMGFRFIKYAIDNCGLDMKGILGYLNASVHPGTLMSFSGEVIGFAPRSWKKIGETMGMNSLRLQWTEKECIVGFSAFRLAHILGANPIYFAGMDLCFNKARYCKNTWHQLEDREEVQSVIKREKDRLPPNSIDKIMEYKKKDGTLVKTVGPYLQGMQAIHWFQNVHRMGKEIFDLSNGILEFPSVGEAT